ncbi:MAG: HDOD domain-containing protein [Chromatiales bacterium]|jgi:HD-like signal output (HDOD) protein
MATLSSNEIYVDEVLHRLGKRLPVLPTASLNLLNLLADKNVEYSRLLQALEQFPSIVMRLIALANSVWSAPISPLNSLDMACNRLGLKLVRSVSIALAVAEPFDPSRCASFDAKKFWVNSLMRAEAAGLLAKSEGCLDIHTIRTAALLSNLGLLWLADNMPQETSRAINLANADKDICLNQALKQHYQLGYDEVGEALLRYWRLPVVLQHAVANQFARRHTEQLCIDYVVASAARLVSSLDHKRSHGSEAGIEIAGLDQQDIEQISFQLRDNHAAIQELAQTLF